MLFALVLGEKHTYAAVYDFDFLCSVFLNFAPPKSSPFLLPVCTELMFSLINDLLERWYSIFVCLCAWSFCNCLLFVYMHKQCQCWNTSSSIFSVIYTSRILSCFSFPSFFLFLLFSFPKTPPPPPPPHLILFCVFFVVVCVCVCACVIDWFNCLLIFCCCWFCVCVWLVVLLLCFLLLFFSRD